MVKLITRSFHQAFKSLQVLKVVARQAGSVGNCWGKRTEQGSD